MGKIPAGLLAEGTAFLMETPETERFFTIVHDNGEYRLDIPSQEGTPSRLTYQPRNLPVIAEFHSHTRHEPRFSSTDDQDELAFRIYGVIGPTTGPKQALNLRLGVYGHFRYLSPPSVFNTARNSDIALLP